MHSADGESAAGFVVGEGGGRGGGADQADCSVSGSGAGAREETPTGLGVKEWNDGSRYEGGIVNGLKHGKGRFSWRNGEYFEGYFYKDYRHGDAVYCWPTGHKFIGKFYLNRREGHGQHAFPDGTTFQGLYHNDQRFGPGVMSYPDGRQDVGLWLGERLLKLCSSVEDCFSLKSFPEYAAYLDPNATADSFTQASVDGDLLSDDNFILPPGIESYSADGDHLPLPPGRRRELDQLFHGKLWESHAHPHKGYERDPLSSLPLQTRMQAHINNHRLYAKNIGWDMAAVLSMNRESFGPKGPLEVSSELMIQHASQGDLHALSQILQTGDVHPDVADASGHTALIAATINCHNDVINLLLDMGVDIDKLNHQGMSALAVCHILYYPFQCLDTALTESSSKALDDEGEVNHGMCTYREDTRRDKGDQKRREVDKDSKEEGNQTDSGCVHAWGKGESEVKIMEGEYETQEKKEVYVETMESTATETRNENKEKGPELLEHVESIEERGNEEVPAVERSIQVLDGHIALGHVQWREHPVKDKDQDPTTKQAFDSAGSVSSFNIQVTEEVMQRSAEALSRIGVLRHCDTQGTVRKMAAMKIEHRVRLNTLKLLLERGADPNVSVVPMPVLFLAIMAADTEAVRRLLLCGARTDIPLPAEKKGLYPLHVAAALPGSAGPRITELLLHAITDPDSQACDQDEMYEQDRTAMTATELLCTSEVPHLKGGGRTALHVACQRDSDYQNASEVVALLVSHRARTDLLWSGHSPLSLAIASGNDLAVEVLLNGGADPNILLGPTVGSALCALVNINYSFVGNRIKLLKMLAKAGADFLMPVKVGEDMGTVIDYAHHSFKQDVRIANTPFHALNVREMETYKARRQLLTMMGEFVKNAAAQKEKENLERERILKLNSKCNLSANFQLDACDPSLRKPQFKFCYYCGRSVSVKLTACSSCHRVLYCSKACKRKAWDEGHKKECMEATASVEGPPKATEIRASRGTRPLTVMLKSKTAAGPPGVTLKSQRVTKPVSMEKKVPETQINPKENYSFN
ncbi:ankyrin repeat and MYND domain-containing protein 1 [Salarias fasciatus]|uniref:ankyrin repeat and MYND domain-containing protein 1 n=1 Tax=Salarias fasciatus TaxID=181472 RepID=UPI001177004E|nr:ankyrin repeat and MYND domain-containing protein 1-like [Salarias fasciatus]